MSKNYDGEKCLQENEVQNYDTFILQYTLKQ